MRTFPFSCAHWKSKCNLSLFAVLIIVQISVTHTVFIAWPTTIWRRKPKMERSCRKLLMEVPVNTRFTKILFFNKKNLVELTSWHLDWFMDPAGSYGYAYAVDMSYLLFSIHCFILQYLIKGKIVVYRRSIPPEWSYLSPTLCLAIGEKTTAIKFCPSSLKVWRLDIFEITKSNWWVCVGNYSWRTWSHSFSSIVAGNLFLIQ